MSYQKREKLEPGHEFIVAHDAVHQYFRGQRVTVEHFPPDTDFYRLLDLGALVHADSHAAQEVLSRYTPDSVAPNSVRVMEEVPVPPMMTTPAQPPHPAVAPGPATQAQAENAESTSPAKSKKVETPNTA